MWDYKGNQIREMSDLEGDFEGFVYLIYNTTTDKSYIGRKSFFSRRKKNLTKKELTLLVDKRAKKYKHVIAETKWQDYTGSNKDLNQDIKDGHIIIKEILQLCKTKSEMTYYETKLQFTYEVLESDKFYNSNILGKFYPKIFENEI